ncbi:MAG: hypothetical protein VW258_03275 [Thalassolituus sp.]
MIPSSVITPIPTGWSQDSESRGSARTQNEQKATNQTNQRNAGANAQAEYIPAVPDNETLEWLASERRAQQQTHNGPTGLYTQVDTLKQDDRRGSLLDIYA